MWIQWWCPLCDWGDQYCQIYKCYISSKTVFWCEFNGDVCCVIKVAIYGNTNKYTSVVYHLEPFFNVNSMVMSIVWLERPHMAIETKKFLKTLSRLRSKTRKLDNVKAKIQDKEVSQYIVKAKIQDKEVSQIQCHVQDPGQYSSCSLYFNKIGLYIFLVAYPIDMYVCG